MDPYVGIVVFELEASPMAAQPSFFREDFYVVYADTQEEAYARVERIAKDQEIPKDPDSDESRAVTVRYIVDVARLYTTTFMKTATYIPDILRHLPTTSGLK